MNSSVTSDASSPDPKKETDSRFRSHLFLQAGKTYQKIVLQSPTPSSCVNGEIIVLRCAELILSVSNKFKKPFRQTLRQSTHLRPSDPHFVIFIEVGQLSMQTNVPARPCGNIWPLHAMRCKSPGRSAAAAGCDADGPLKEKLCLPLPR
jgi:hypothetical protein